MANEDKQLSPIEIFWSKVRIAIRSNMPVLRINMANTVQYFASLLDKYAKEYDYKLDKLNDRIVEMQDEIDNLKTKQKTKKVKK